MATTKPTAEQIQFTSEGGVARNLQDKLSEYISVKDFGAVGDGVTDDTAAIQDTIMKANSGTVTNILIPPGTYRITSDLAQLTKPVRIVGSGRRHCHLVFDNCNGFRFDLSSTSTLGGRYTNTVITEISILTNTTGKTGLHFKGVQSYAPHDPALSLIAVSFDTQWVYDNKVSVTAEWQIGVFVDNTDEVLFDACYLNGSANNSAHSTRTSSTAVKIDTCTGFRCINTQIYQFGKGLDVVGQSEGLIIQGGTIVAVDKGIHMHNLLNPANNHTFSNTHISSYSSAIHIENTLGYIPLAVFVQGCFLLEREGSAGKSEYVAIDAYLKRSVISGITIQSNNTATPARIGIRINNSNNILSDICALNTGTLVNVVDDGLGGYSTLANSVASGDLQNLVSGEKSRLVQIGNWMGVDNTINFNSTGFRVNDANGNSVFTLTGPRTLLGGSRANSTVYIDFRSSVNGSSSYDARILAIGGDSGAVNGQASLYLYGSVYSAGDLRPDVDNTRTLGSGLYRWSQVYSATGAINTSDEREKQDIDSLNAAELRVAKGLRGLIKKFRFKDAVRGKGDAARIHVGVIAQEVMSAFQAEGLDANRYGIICYDEWDEQQEILNSWGTDFDEGGNTIRESGSEVIRPYRPAGNRYGVRYEELLAFIIASS